MSDPIIIAKSVLNQLFHIIARSDPRGDNLAKSHYSVKKRRKELARKLKQEQKRQRKLDKKAINPEEAIDKSQDEVKNPQV